MKELENKITEFAHAKGIQSIVVLEHLIDYIIGYLDPTHTPNKEWKYGKEDNIKFHEMMRTYFNILQREIEKKEWFDAWGDLFMSLITKGGQRGQFFTPSSLCNMMSEISLKEEPQATQLTTFGRRVVINDPTCGSSRNLLASSAVFERNKWRKPYLVGEDLDLLCCKMSAVNMAVHGCFGEVVCHNTLTEPNKVKAGYIINETMWPFPSNMPSIRPCSDESKFFCVKVANSMKRTKEKEDAEKNMKPDNTIKGTQLELF